MEDKIKNFLIKGIYLGIILFAILYVIFQPATMYDVLGHVGEAISGATVLLGIYENWLWKFNPFEKTPKLMGSYSGHIEYNYACTPRKKKATIEIKQSLLSVTVKIITNEMTSNSIASNLIFENGEYVLYYTYITTPKSKYSKENPIQFGTCRLFVKNETELQGIYWTNRKTIGDIHLKKG